MMTDNESMRGNIMNIEGLLSILGQPISNNNVIREFESIGVNALHNVHLGSDSYRAYLEKQNDGISFVFTDEAQYLNKENQAIGKGPLYFTGVFLYAEGKDGYSQFNGVIPKGIVFSDTREKLVEKLGPPSWGRKRADESIAAERWDFQEYRIHITYSKEHGLPIVISISKPDQKRNK